MFLLSSYALFSVAAIATRESLDVVVVYVKQRREELIFFSSIPYECKIMKYNKFHDEK
jgi:hypothetical protein